MKKLLLFPCLFLIVTGTFAQKEIFDIVSYDPPAGWKKETTGDYVSYSKTNAGQWSQVAIYKSAASKGDIGTDIQTEWKTLVLSLHPVTKEETSQPGKTNGWVVMSRSGTWKYNGGDVASVLTTFSNGKACVSILCNATSQTFIKEFQRMIASVELPQSSQSGTNNRQSLPDNGAGKSSLAGLWVEYDVESFGVLNGTPALTGGYFRSEYAFYTDGTYLYRAKDWSTTVKEIRFVYESGTYAVNGNKLTITPVKGKGEWWSKAASGRTSEWGSRLRTFDPKLEKVTYNFELKYLSGMENTYLLLKHNKPTLRESRQSKSDEFSYSHREMNKSLIDTPPGTKTGFEGRK